MNNNDMDFYSHTDELKQMKRGFDKMYNSLVDLNWCKGGNLGMAWQKALEQMSAFVKSKTQMYHPANEYIKQLDIDNRKTMSEYIMKSEFSDNVFEKSVMKDDTAVKNWEKVANKECRSGLDCFNEVYRKYRVLDSKQQTHQLAEVVAQKIRENKMSCKGF